MLSVYARAQLARVVYQIGELFHMHFFVLFSALSFTGKSVVRTSLALRGILNVHCSQELPATNAVQQCTYRGGKRFPRINRACFPPAPPRNMPRRNPVQAERLVLQWETKTRRTSARTTSKRPTQRPCAKARRTLMPGLGHRPRQATLLHLVRPDRPWCWTRIGQRPALNRAGRFVLCGRTESFRAPDTGHHPKPSPCS